MMTQQQAEHLLDRVFDPINVRFGSATRNYSTLVRVQGGLMVVEPTGEISGHVDLQDEYMLYVRCEMKHLSMDGSILVVEGFGKAIQ